MIMILLTMSQSLKYLQLSGNTSEDEPGMVVYQTRQELSSPPWCTPHHHPGWWCLSSGSWLHTTHLEHPSSLPTQPYQRIPCRGPWGSWSDPQWWRLCSWCCCKVLDWSSSVWPSLIQSSASSWCCLTSPRPQQQQEHCSKLLPPTTRTLTVLLFSESTFSLSDS